MKFVLFGQAVILFSAMSVMAMDMLGWVSETVGDRAAAVYFVTWALFVTEALIAFGWKML